MQGQLRRMTADIFGYYALEAGVLAEKGAFLRDSRVANRFVQVGSASEGGDLVAIPDDLPFVASNLDLVVASHTLDCSVNPHQVLREVERVLVPEGHCILVGFNPLSLHGMGQLRHWLMRQPLACRMYSQFRVRDWLGVLGFDVLETMTLGVCPPMAGEWLFRHTRWLERWGGMARFGVGSVYIIHAQKKVSKMTPLLPSRRASPVLRPGIVVNPGVGRVSGQRRGHAEKNS